MELYQLIENYCPINEQEEKDREELLFWLKNGKGVFSRSNTAAHFTASAWVVSPDREKVLMVYHNLYDSWAWMGGHADGEEDLLKVARKEVMEECGISQIKPLSDEIFSLEVLCVDGHVKRGSYVSSHLHLNVTFLMEADPGLPIFMKPDENSGVAWFTTDEVLDKVTEPWFRDHIYTKLMQKVEKLG